MAARLVAVNAFGSAAPAGAAHAIHINAHDARTRFI